MLARAPRRSHRSSQASAANGDVSNTAVARSAYRARETPERDRDRDGGPQRIDDEADAELVRRRRVRILVELLRDEARELVRQPVGDGRERGEREVSTMSAARERALVRREVEARPAMGHARDAIVRGLLEIELRP